MVSEVSYMENVISKDGVKLNKYQGEAIAKMKNTFTGSGLFFKISYSTMLEKQGILYCHQRIQS